MRSLEKGQDKIQKICDKLRGEVIDPAKTTAEEILKEAHRQAGEIKAEAGRHAEELINRAKSRIEQERNVFHSSLQLAAKQTLESLRQEIECKFFNEELQNILETRLSDPKIVADIINGLVTAMEKEGLNADFSVAISKAVSVDDVNALLLDGIKKQLKNRPLEIGHFAGGAQVKLHGKKMTLDITDPALKELLANYIRKDFRKMIFSR